MLAGNLPGLAQLDYILEVRMITISLNRKYRTFGPISCPNGAGAKSEETRRLCSEKVSHERCSQLIDRTRHSQEQQTKQ